MPLTTEQKRSFLSSKGFDPDSHDLQETPDGDGYSVVPLNNAMPTATSVGPTQQAFTTAQTSSTLGAAGRSALNAAPSAIGGGLGAMGGTALAVALAPESFGASLLFPLAGALLGSGAGNAAKNVAVNALPQGTAINQQLSLDQQQHPYATTAGSLAALPLGGLSPSPRNLITAGRTIGKMATGIGASAPEIGNLANIGVGAGIAGGQAAVEPLFHGQTPEVGDVLKSAALGALFNKPNAIGRGVYGFHGATPEAIADAARIQPEMPYTSRQTTATTLNGPDYNESVARQTLMKDRYGNNVDAGKADMMGAMQQRLQAEKDALAAEQMRAAHLQTTATRIDSTQLRLQNDALEQQLSDQQRYASTTTPTTAIPISREAAPKVKVPIDTTLAYTPTDQATMQQFNEAQGKGTTAYQSEEQPTLLEGTPADRPTIARRLKASEIGQPSPLTTANDVPVVFPNNDKTAKPTGDRAGGTAPVKPDYINYAKELAARLGLKHNVDVTFSDGQLVSADGKPVNGSLYVGDILKQAVAKFGTGAVAKDWNTVPHEFIHDLFQQLGNSPKAGDKALHDKLISLADTAKPADGASSYRDWLQNVIDTKGADTTVDDVVSGKTKLFGDTHPAEEYWAQHTGELFKHIAENPQGESFGKSLMSALKVKYGNPTTEDVGRLLTNKLHGGEDYAQRFSSGGVASKPTTSNQDKDQAKVQGAGDFGLEIPHEISRYFPSQDKQLMTSHMLATLRNKKAGEYSLLDSLGTFKDLPSAMTPKQLQEHILANGPQAKVVEYGQSGKVSEAKAALDKMTHELYDSNPSFKVAVKMRKDGKDWGYITNPEGVNTESDLYKEVIDPKFQQSVDKYVDLAKKVSEEPPDTSPRATQYYNQVSPKDTKQYPVKRVDVVLPHSPTETVGPIGKNKQIPAYEISKQPLWQQDNLHENLPNTLGWAAIQYHDLPNGGGKVAHIYEAQSRWGQSKRTADVQHEQRMVDMRKHKDYTPASEEYLRQQHEKDYPSHPLLAQHQRLILKAAIRQATKDGATHIALSDAPTAMMTEGHDAQSAHRDVGEMVFDTKAEANKTSADYDGLMVEPMGNKWRVRFPLDQEAGMRLNYDKVMTKMLEELTGSKGEPISFGEHKNAKNDRSRIDNFVHENEAIQHAQTTGGSVSRNQHGSWNVHSGPLIRENLIFKNPDGTPKTDASARMYPLENAKQRLADNGGKPTFTNKFYQDENQPRVLPVKAPAIRTFDGKVIEGQQGDTHADIVGRAIKARELKDLDFTRGFVSQDGKWLTREEASALLKEPKPLQSERLNELQGGKTSYSSADQPKTLGLTRPLVDTVAKITDDGRSKSIADAAIETRNTKQEYMGRFHNPVMDAMEKATPVDRAKVLKLLNQEVDDKSSYAGSVSNNAQRNLYNSIRESLGAIRDQQIENKQPVLTASGVAREAGKDPYYMPQSPDKSTLDAIRENTDLAKVGTIKDKFMEYWKSKDAELTDEDAKDLWDRFSGAIRGDLSNVGSQIHSNSFFNAIRRTEGLGVPPDLREGDLRKVMARYNNRATSDMSWYKHIEGNSDVGPLVGYSKDLWGTSYDKPVDQSLAGHQDVKNLVGHLRGESADFSEQGIKKLEAASTVSLLGPLTEIHKAISIVTQAITASHPADVVKHVTSALTSLSDGYKNALDYGSSIKSGRTLADNARTLVDGSVGAVEKLSAGTALLRASYTLNGMTDRFNSAFTNAYGESWASSAVARAKAGDNHQLALLKRLDPSINLEEPNVPKLASLFAEQLHGAKDVRNMPNWMLNDNEIGAFMKLMHWQVGATNNFMTNVWTPATRGNVVPLLTSALGTVLGGYVIKQLREAVSDRKGPIPTLTDLINSDINKKQGFEGRSLEDNKSLIAYHGLELASMAGFGGLISTMAKSVMDMAYKNKPQGAIFPLDELASSTAVIGDRVLAALHQGDSDMLDVLKRASVDWMKTNVQMARIAVRQLGDNLPDEKQRHEYSEALGELRRFKMASGLPYEDQSSFGTENPYLDLSAQSLKREKDPSKIAEELPQVVHHLMGAYGSQPTVLLNKLEALKKANYETMPSIDNDPLGFGSYYNYKKLSDGEKSATSTLIDYLKTKALNQAKSAAIP